MAHFDLVIIGTGSGNSILSHEFEDWNVAIVERAVFGGTCLNVGCIPSKMLVLPADRMVEALEATDLLDVDIEPRGVDWPGIQQRVFGRIDAIVEGGTHYRRNQPNVTVIDGDGRFVGDHELQVTAADGTTTSVTGDQFVLAAGARPRIPDVPGLLGTPFHTSDTIMRVDKLPDRLIILGGGFIAAEMGHVFSGLGSSVTVVHRGDRMLRHEDAEISKRFTDAFAERVELLMNTTACGIEYADGEFRLDLVGSGEETPGSAEPGPDEGERRVLTGDALLITTGRDPNGGQLGVTATGVELDHEGYVVTDDTLATGVPGIWALGDIRNNLQLKHLANQEARVVQHNLLHPDSPITIDQRVVPHAVFSHPQVGSVGLTEADLAQDGRRYVVGRCDYAGVAYGWALNDTTGFAKILIDPADLSILGGHILGPQAASLVQQITQAMAFGIPADRLAREQIWCHPALPEVLENALLHGLHQVSAGVVESP